MSDHLGVSPGPVRLGQPPDVTSLVGVATPDRGRLSDRLRSTLADPATRSSLALMLSAVGGGLLTFVFWSVIARRTGPAVVGAASAEVSTITFLASVGSLNLINVFARFLPEAGHLTRRFICVAYACACLAGLTVALIFESTSWSSGLIGGGAGSRVGFVVLVTAASVFLIQDGGLIGLGRARFVPVENVLVAGARLLGVCVVALTAATAARIVLAWALPLVVAVVVVNYQIIRRWAPAEAHRASRLPTRHQLGTFVAVESVTTAISSSVTAFLPAVVSRTMGTTDAGYFYIPWLVATTAALLLMAILISMVRESVTHPERAAVVVRRCLTMCAAIVVGGTLGCCFAAPVLLGVLGPSFVEGSGSLLVWIGLSLPATGIGLVYWSLCLIGRRPWPVFAMNLTTSAAIIGGVIALGPGDVSRIGTLYFAVQWVVALAVVRPAFRKLRQITQKRGPA